MNRNNMPLLRSFDSIGFSQPPAHAGGYKYRAPTELMQGTPNYPSPWALLAPGTAFHCIYHVPETASPTPPRRAGAICRQRKRSPELLEPSERKVAPKKEVARSPV